MQAASATWQGVKPKANAGLAKISPTFITSRPTPAIILPNHHASRFYPSLPFLGWNKIMSNLTNP